jgi:integrase
MGPIMGRKGNSVEVRASSIRITFYLDNEQIKERLTLNGKSLPPTPANQKYAVRVADEIKRRIELETFTFAEFFPDSERAQSEKKEANLFGNLADLWLESCGKLEAATKSQYATAVRFWKAMLGESKPINKIEHKFIAAKIGGYPWPSAKTHRGHTAMNSPMIGIENMTVVKKLPDPLSIDERDSILEDMQARYDVRIYAYFLFMFFTGMRPEEAIALRWSDIDRKNGIARIRRVRTFKGSERDGSKTNTERDIDLVDQAIHAIDLMRPYTYMQRTNDEVDQAADIFMNPVTGRPWHDERSQRDHYWRPTLKRLGIRWRTAYCTRHTFATAALMGGVRPGYVAEQLGHSLRMLMDRYQKWMPENDKGQSRKMLNSAMGSSNCSQIVPNVKIAKS